MFSYFTIWTSFFYFYSPTPSDIQRWDYEWGSVRVFNFQSYQLKKWLQQLEDETSEGNNAVFSFFFFSKDFFRLSWMKIIKQRMSSLIRVTSVVGRWCPVLDSHYFSPLHTCDSAVRAAGWDLYSKEWNMSPTAGEAQVCQDMGYYYQHTQLYSAIRRVTQLTKFLNSNIHFLYLLYMCSTKSTH